MWFDTTNGNFRIFLIKMDKKLNEIRKEMIGQLEQRLGKSQTLQDDMFYHHSSEDRIVLSHALFRVISHYPARNLSFQCR